MYDAAPRRDVSFGARYDCHATETCKHGLEPPLQRHVACTRHGKTELQLTRVLFGDVEPYPVPSAHRDGWAKGP